MDDAAVLVECNGAARIAQGSCSHKGFVHVIKDMGVCSGWWEVKEWQCGRVGGSHDLAISYLYFNWCDSRVDVCEEGLGGEKVPGAARVEDNGRGGT